MSNIRHFYSNNSEWQRITGRGFIKTFDADEIPEGVNQMNTLIVFSTHTNYKDKR